MDIKILGAKIQRLREGLDISQQSLATKLGWARTTVSKLEIGNSKVPPSKEDLRIIAKALETTAEELTGDAEAFFFDRFTKEEQELLRNPESTRLIKAALAAMRA